MNKLRKNTILLLVFIHILILVSCKEKQVIEPDIRLAQEEINFSGKSGSSLLTINTNLPWKAESSQSWCSLTPASGDPGTHYITVAVTANATSGTREAQITITSGSLSKYNIDAAGADITIALQSTSPFITSIQPTWITLKSTSADGKTLAFSVSENTLTQSREGTITFTLGDITEIVTVRQAAKNIGIPADKSGMESDALVLAKKMTLGWNLGNTLEAIGSETAWGNPKTSKTLIDAVKATGFNAVRIPCAWNGYIED
ncbi:MAG: Cellulase, partial [Bacteroidetes bacterium]|nr:Cellulase [Bacteroidota bacterium]